MLPNYIVANNIMTHELSLLTLQEYRNKPIGTYEPITGDNNIQIASQLLRNVKNLGVKQYLANIQP